MVNRSTEHPQHVEFWFDPLCPWAWITSRWITEVAQTLSFDVTWHPFSLKVLNGDDDSNPYSEGLRLGHRMGQVSLAAAAQHGAGIIAQLYTEYGTRLHNEGRQDGDAVIVESLEALDLDPGLLATAEDESRGFDEQLHESTNRGIEIVGPGVGIPIIAIDGRAFFGPVLSPAPRGADAVKLWNAVVAASQIPNFFELKRGREVGPDFS